MVVIQQLLVLENGYNTKTKLQQLAEGIIDGRPPKNKNKTKNKENIKNNTKEEAPYKNKQKELWIIEKEVQKTGVLHTRRIFCKF